MDIRQLESFAAVAAAGSITAASQQLYVGQPALTRQIAALERKIGFVLFERHPNGMRLTERGEQFLQQAQSVLAAYAQLLASNEEPPRSARSRGQRALRIGLLDEGFGSRTMSVLRGFAESLPDVELSVVPLTRPHRQHPFKDNAFDLDVVVGVDPPPESDQFETLVAYHEERVAAVSRRSDLADAHALTVGDLVGRTFCRLDNLTASMQAMFGLDRERGERAHFSDVECEPEIPSLLQRVATSTDVMTFTVGVKAFRNPDVTYVPLSGAIDIPKNVTWRVAGHPQAERFARIAQSVCTLVPS